MKIYIAARYSRKEEVAFLVNGLLNRKFDVISTWHKESWGSGTQLSDVSPVELMTTADRDIAEIDEADVLILLTEPPNEPHVRGGRHVEFGYALAKEKILILFGPKENIFHYIPGIYHVETHDGILSLLRSLELSPPLKADSETIITDPTTGGRKGQKPARFDLIPPQPLWDLSLIYGMGAVKYTDDNWRKGYSWRLSIGAMFRHIYKFLLGEYLDPESKLPHLAHAVWHGFTLMEFHRLKLGTDDRYKDSQNS